MQSKIPLAFFYSNGVLLPHAQLHAHQASQVLFCQPAFQLAGPKDVVPKNYFSLPLEV